MDAGLLDVLHDGADHGGLAVGDAVDVDFGGVVEEAVDEDGTLG